MFDSWSGSLAPAEFERWVIAPDRAAGRRRCSERHPGRSDHRLSQGRRRQARALMRAKPGSMRSGSTRPSIRPGRAASCPTGLPVQGNLDPLALLAGGEALRRRGARESLTPSPAGRTSSISATASSRTRRSRHVEELMALVKGSTSERAAADRISRRRPIRGSRRRTSPSSSSGWRGCSCFRASTSITMRPTPARPRTAPGSSARTARRTIILTPAMLIVWVLGLMLAFHLDAFGQDWFTRQAGAGRRADRLSGLARRLWQASSPPASGRCRATARCG